MSASRRRERITRCAMARRPKAVEAGTGDVFVDLDFVDAGERKRECSSRCRSTSWLRTGA